MLFPLSIAPLCVSSHRSQLHVSATGQPDVNAAYFKEPCCVLDFVTSTVGLDFVTSSIGLDFVTSTVELDFVGSTVGLDFVNAFEECLHCVRVGLASSKQTMLGEKWFLYVYRTRTSGVIWMTLRTVVLRFHRAACNFTLK